MAKNTEIIRIKPHGHMEILSQLEVNQLKQGSKHSNSYELFRRCSLAVLNVGSIEDDSKQVLEKHLDFSIRVISEERGIQLEFQHAPASAFVDGRLIAGIQEQLFAVLRDIVYTKNDVETSQCFNLGSTAGITNAVFHILRNARVLVPESPPNLVVCWGGHLITRGEYDYSKEVGYQLGLRDLNICTGCGPGAMKGPMKGATIGHSKQRLYNGRYIGITEPGIIAAESPNPIVNELVIMPDMEKRLEAFVRVGHGIVVFPGGVGTAEEILYILGILLNPKNRNIPLPLIFTGPDSAREYFQRIHDFIGMTLGKAAQERYQIIIDNSPMVAREINLGLEAVRRFRHENSDAYYFNWLLEIDHAFQKPLILTHDSIADLVLTRDLDRHQLAANLRQVFSAIVAANVKETGIAAIQKFGPFKIQGEPEIMRALDALLGSFVDQKRMKMNARGYSRCYQINQ